MSSAQALGILCVKNYDQCIVERRGGHDVLCIIIIGRRYKSKRLGSRKDRPKLVVCDPFSLPAEGE